MQVSTSSLRKWRIPVILPVLSLMMFFIGFEMGGFQLCLRSISETFQTSAIMMGVLAASQYVGVIVMPLLFGHVADRIGKKKVLVVFAVTFALGCGIAALSGGIFTFILGVLFIGAGYSVCECTGSAALADQSPEKSVRYINFTQGMLSFGAVLSPVLIKAGINSIGWTWRAMFAICAIAYAVLLIALLLTPVGQAPKQSNFAVRGLHIGSFLRSRIYVLLLVSILLYVGLENGIGYFSESLFALRLSSEALGAYAISAYWLCMAVSRLAFSFSHIPIHKALMVSMTASFVLFAVLAFSRVPAMSLIACGLIGFAFGPVWSSLVGLAAKEFPDNSGGAIGLMSTGCGIGGALFPTLMGYMADSYDFSIAFVMLSITALAAGILCFIVQRKTTQTV